MSAWDKPKTHEDRTDAENLALLSKVVRDQLDGCGYCQIGNCNAIAHSELKRALIDATGAPYQSKRDRALADDQPLPENPPYESFLDSNWQR